MSKVAVVTGASGGIGRAVAFALADATFSVAVLYGKNQAAAEKTVQQIVARGGCAQAYGCDLCDSDAVQQTAEKIQTQLGAAAVLVNCAGISAQKQFQDITDADWAQMLGVHLTGAFYLTRALLPGMLHNKAGRIVNIASVWGETGGACEVHYSAAKAGLIGMTKALAKELAPSGITVNAVSPGAVDTAMMWQLGDAVCQSVAAEIPLGRLGTPEDVARAVLFLAGDGGAYITGQVLAVNGGYHI